MVPPFLAFAGAPPAGVPAVAEVELLELPPQPARPMSPTSSGAASSRFVMCTLLRVSMRRQCMRRLGCYGLTRGDADRARDAGPAQAAVAARVLGQVLLVVGLGVVERARRRDLSADLAVAGLAQALLEHRGAVLRRLRLRVGERVDRRAVLRADVISLTHALRRVVVLPEELEQLLVARLLGVEDDQDGLGVAGGAGADLLVGGVRRLAAGVADRRRVDARGLPEDALG